MVDGFTNDYSSHQFSQAPSVPGPELSLVWYEHTSPKAKQFEKGKKVTVQKKPQNKNKHPKLFCHCLCHSHTDTKTISLKECIINTFSAERGKPRPLIYRCLKKKNNQREKKSPMFGHRPKVPALCFKFNSTFMLPTNA